jgi:hypothetical protein
MFESKRGFRLLSGFLCSILPIYFPEVLMMDLLELFQPLTLRTLQAHMIEVIWLSLNLAVRLRSPPAVFFSSTFLLYQGSKAVFKTILWFDFMIAQAVDLFTEPSEIANTCWECIHKLLSAPLPVETMTSIFLIALAHYTFYSSSRALSLIEKFIDQASAVELSSISHLVSPLFAFPDLHEQTLRILQRFPDASVAANITLRASHLISIVNPQATVAAVRDCFFGLGKGIAFPPLLPVFVTAAGKLSLQDRNAYCREFVDRILAAPEKAHGITVVNCWYSWLFRFFEVCDLEDKTFWRVFALILDCELSVDHVNHVSDFLLARPEYRWLQREILQYLLRPLAKSASRFGTLFDPRVKFPFL